MEALKQYILNFYKSHDSKCNMSFQKTMADLSLSESELDSLLRALICDGFIECTQDADNVAYYFRLVQ